MKRTLLLMSCGLVCLAAAGESHAALIESDPNVLTDGVMEYLTMAEAGGIHRDTLMAKLAAGVNGHTDWRLGTRAEFYNMVRRNLSRPLANYTWNDALFSSGGPLNGDDVILANAFDNPSLSLLRSGSPDLAQELKALILLFTEGNPLGPAFSMVLRTGEMADADNRYMCGLQAYYNSATGTSFSRNDTISGPDALGTRAILNENLLYSMHWFVLREVPEPATLAMLAIGGLALLRRRRK